MAQQAAKKVGHVLLVLLIHIVESSASSRRPWLDGIPTALPLISKKRVSRNADIYKFSMTPRGEKEEESNLTLGLEVCSCLLVSPPNNRTIVRPYTPISSRHETNSFSLLVKRYPKGAMSREWKRLKKGKSLLFWQIPKNIKEQYPFGKPRTILMLAAGTGITPMYQALLRLFGKDETNETQHTQVVLIHACHSMSDAYLKSELEKMQQRYPHHLFVIRVISKSKRIGGCQRQTKHSHRYGRIDKQMLQEICDNVNLIHDKKKCHVWVCGPASFYTDLCGTPREDPTVSGVLKELGLDKHVVKF